MRGVDHESGASRSLFIKPNLIFATWLLKANPDLDSLCQRNRYPPQRKNALGQKNLLLTSKSAIPDDAAITKTK
jgi:hypothetical protein